MTETRGNPNRNKSKSESSSGSDGRKDDFQRLEDIKTEMLDRFDEMVRNRDYIPKVGDLVKIIELQRKLSSDSDAEGRFWEFIERLRQEELKHA